MDTAVADAGNGVEGDMSSRNATVEPVANAEKGVTCTEAMSNNLREFEKKRRRVMRLHLVRGSLVTGNAVGGVGCEMMDAEVWSRLPEELIWEVLRFVPAANYFRLQLVSCQWQQTLISADFCSQSRVVEQQPPVVACVTGPPLRMTIVLASHSSSSSSEVERKVPVVVVDIDLSSFVPSWLWNSDSYCKARPGVHPDKVVVAGDGVMCISNNKIRQYFEEERLAPWWRKRNPLTKDHYCIPLDGWCWLPPTCTALTIYGYKSGAGTDMLGRNIQWQGPIYVATYDLTASGRGTARWEVAAAREPHRHRHSPPHVALCGGEMFWLECLGSVHVMTVPRAGNGPAVEVAQVEEPSLETLGMGPKCRGWWSRCLAAHRGAIYFAQTPDVRSDEADVVVMAVWRLARTRLEWELVARLVVGDVVRLTGLKPSDVVTEECSVVKVKCASGVRESELLYWSFRVWKNSRRCGPWVVALNLDTGEWELVHDGQCKVLELRPDVFV